MNNDLISREALKAQIEQYQIQWNKNCDIDIAKWNCCGTILAIIDNAPTVTDEIIATIYDKYMSCDGQIHNDTANEIIKLIKENKPKQGEWIPVSERLPNCNGCYNVTRKLKEGETIYFISDVCYFDGQNTWHSDTGVNHGRPYLNDIIAWQPLPEPYKKEGITSTKRQCKCPLIEIKKGGAE